MSRYINLKDAVNVVRNTVAEGTLESTLELRLLDKSLTADVRENVRGAWLKGEYYSNGYKEEWIFPYCSICHYETDKMYKFCPNCGADMRGES